MAERIYLLPKEGELYKTNLHCHTTVSDGAFTPLEIKEMYQARGYHAVAYTDHEECVPHTELTDENFVALTGLEIAFGIGMKTSVHVCGISREPEKTLFIENDRSDETSHVSAGARHLRAENFITTLNHPRWSAILPAELSKVEGVDNMEVVNGYEKVHDGYGYCDALLEAELRLGRVVRPVGADDSHRATPEGGPGYEYFQGFTMIKAPELSYNALIDALDAGNFYASSGPSFSQLWLEDDVLHVECSAVRGIYVHGSEYCHRGYVFRGEDSLTEANITLNEKFKSSRYIFVILEDMQGRRAWSVPYWFHKGENA